jgi:hypothetical protein
LSWAKRRTLCVPASLGGASFIGKLAALDGLLDREPRGRGEKELGRIAMTARREVVGKKSRGGIGASTGCEHLRPGLGETQGAFFPEKVTNGSEKKRFPRLLILKNFRTVLY